MKFKLIYTATGDNVTDRFGNLITFTNEADAEKAAKSESNSIFQEKPYDFSEGGFLYGTSKPIVSVGTIDEVGAY